jgi:hypothetical protein
LVGHGSWFLGYPDQALQRIDKALTLAKELTHPWLRSPSSITERHFWGTSGTVRPPGNGRSGNVTATEHGLARHAALAPILRGWALAMQNRGGGHIAQIRQGLVAHRGLGMAMKDPYFLALLAEAHASVGRIEEEHAALAEAWWRCLAGETFL